MSPTGILFVLASLVAAPALALGSPSSRRAWWGFATLGWLGLFLVAARVTPELGTAAALLGPLVLAPWLILWGAVGVVRRRRAAAASLRPTSP
jgi:hypothetical protein